MKEIFKKFLRDVKEMSMKCQRNIKEMRNMKNMKCSKKTGVEDMKGHYVKLKKYLRIFKEISRK